MVLAVLPVVSASRLAARPVGAASTHFSFLAAKISRMLRTRVVLPTPGPPVMTSIFCWHACRIASCWPAANLMPSFALDPADGLLHVDRGQRDAAWPRRSGGRIGPSPTSARWRPVRYSQGSPSTFSRMTAFSA